MRKIILLLLLLASLPSTRAGELVIRVTDDGGGAIGEAVVWAVARQGAAAKPPRPAVMDQRNRKFIPHVLVVQTGATVSFPNSDNVRHQVYSFSPPKSFQLPLYTGTPANPILFDKPGIVSLGCNIHDEMSAFIVVVDTSHFGTTSGDGLVVIPGMSSGDYSVHVWHPDMRTATPARSITLAGARTELSLTITRSRRGDARP
ncbi:MAG TPA: methylamine utilization protein [Thermoanaerobaculia bacterium]|nr:methylamine utilization protein [Thermoanaerobaculia bacterium]